MNDHTYVSFLDAMKAYTLGEQIVIYHGKSNEIEIPFDSELTLYSLHQLTALHHYTFYDLAFGKWSISP